ncbi:MAG: glutamate racemase [Termitinemataceae bacterium]|nr:MAG: glutamate racemase [Termitinemataceae bacterium]
MIYTKVVFLDSGIGGIPYMKYFTDCYPNISTAYIADNKYFPYGTKTKDQLVKILTELTQKIKNIFDPQIIVLACNTASVSALQELRTQFCDKKFVGTVPALRPAILASKTNCIGLLGTERTIEADYIKQLLDLLQADSRCKPELVAMAAPDLVDFVEHQFESADESAKISIVEKYVDRLNSKGVDGIVLGCTHFLFLREQFIQAAHNAKPRRIEIFDSVHGVSRRIDELLQGMNNDCKNQSLQSDNYSQSAKSKKNIFAITKNDSSKNLWLHRAEQLGMELDSVHFTGGQKK